jgi:glycerol-3-phosphate dehydrogenase (NAD(P)+)
LNSSHQKIGIIGAGGWGTALAILLSQNKHDVTLWAFEDFVVDEIRSNRTNNTYLHGVKISEKIHATNTPADLSGCDFFIVATPTQYIRKLFSQVKFPFADKPIVSVTKGIESNTLLRISELLTDVIGLTNEKYVILTGPSHAEEVSRKIPTTVVAASKNHNLALFIQKIFTNEYFRVYTSEDVTGCEIGSSLKNVIAIASGIIEGAGLGDNLNAALITRGLAEMSRLGLALGADPLTFSGLSGLGDLIVTCNSKYSRNRSVGEQIGKGKSLDEIKREMQMVAEGIYTTESAYKLGLKHKVEMPITEQMYNILFKGVKPLIAIKNLMNRQSKREQWW